MGGRRTVEQPTVPAATATLGAEVEPARTTAEALDLASVAAFDLVVSNVKRKDEDGIDGMQQLRAASITCPAVFYVFQVDPSRPTPPGALGITNRPDVLLYFVIDALERARWSHAQGAAEPVGADERPGKNDAARR